MFKLTTKLAWSNLTKNRKLYFPFALVTILTVAILYIFTSLSTNPHLTSARGGADAKQVLDLGLYIVSIAAVIIILYANSFVIKNRSKELGIYDILGLDKIYIVCMTFMELFIFFILTILLGLVIGFLLDQLSYALLLKLMQVKVVLTSTFQWPVVIKTILLFAVIFMTVWLLNSIRVIQYSTLNLVRENRKGEKKGRFLWLQTIIGLLSLGMGYYLSQTVDKPISALPTFFEAVLLVILGTYILFNAGVTTLLKSLQKWQSYYYKPQNFISISNLIFRMRKNAVGLATITILSTMVLVTIIGTANIYFGGKDSVKDSVPHDFFLSLETNQKSDITLKNLSDKMREFTNENNLKVTKAVSASFFSVGFSEASSSRLKFLNFDNTRSTNKTPTSGAQIMSTEDYNKLTNSHIKLSANQVAVYSDRISFKKDHPLIIGAQTMTIAQVIKTDTLKRRIPNSSSSLLKENIHLIVNDTSKLIPDITKVTGTSSIYTGINVSETEEQQLKLKDKFRQKVEELGNKELGAGIQIASIQSYMKMMGSMLFIGLLLSAVFTIGTVLIIYYKQISEAYEDRNRFVIMQKVGLDDKQVSQIIRRQIIIVFFLPLIFALIHLTFAYHVLRLILGMMGVVNNNLILQITIGFSSIFIIVYLLVFFLTSKAYKQIITN